MKDCHKPLENYTHVSTLHTKISMRENEKQEGRQRILKEEERVIFIVCNLAELP